MASITPYKDGYRVQLFVNGVRDSGTFRTKREASAWASARETEIRERAALPAGSRHTLADAMQKYAEEVSPGKRGERWETIRLKAFANDKDFPMGKIGEITPELLGQWRDARLKKVSAGTVIRDMGLLGSVFDHARREWRWVAVNPMQDVRRPRSPDHREVVISRAEIRRMLHVMGYQSTGPIRSVTHAVAVAFLVALRTGMRAGEICALTWPQVNSDYLAKVGTKTRPRDVPLTYKSSRLVERMRGFDTSLVFGISSQSLDAMFRKYRNRAGLSGFTFHDSRHTAATWLAQKLHTLDLCRMFGWANTKQALTYYNATASDIATRLGKKSPRQSG